MCVIQGLNITITDSLLRGSTAMLSSYKPYTLEGNFKIERAIVSTGPSLKCTLKRKTVLKQYPYSEKMVPLWGVE